MKTAWIFPGGSARSVYTAGVFFAISKMRIEQPDMIIAASGNCPTSIGKMAGVEVFPASGAHANVGFSPAGMAELYIDIFKNMDVDTAEQKVKSVKSSALG